jgi:iron complex transport system substrate-binding protein
MRIVSLVPAATEIVAELGAGKSLVGISHECDWPPSVQHLPRVTTTPIDQTGSSAEIDAAVRSARAEGRAVIAVDRGQLAQLRPDLILTQDVCDVCAVADGEVFSLARALEPSPAVVSLGARSVAGVFADIESIGQAVDRSGAAAALVTRLRDRLEGLRGPGTGEPRRVVCIEWLEPVFLAGHWVPELIAAAGGVDVGAAPGAHSRMATLEEVEALAPDLILVAPCGFGLERAGREFQAFEERLSAAGGRPISSWGGDVWLLDGNSYTSRPGPRVVETAGLVSAALRGVALPGARRWIRSTSQSTA